MGRVVIFGVSMSLFHGEGGYFWCFNVVSCFGLGGLSAVSESCDRGVILIGADEGKMEGKAKIRDPRLEWDEERDIDRNWDGRSGARE